MKTKRTLIAMSLVYGIIVTGGLLLTGCYVEDEGTAQVYPEVDKSKIDRKMLESYSDLAIQNAIIAQHTLYPYHFVNNSAALNGVGTRDLSVLIGHFQQNPGQLNLQKGSVDNTLYQARKQLVLEKLVQAGIAQDKIQLADGLPGGDGMPSGTVIEILKKANETVDSDKYDNTMKVQF